MDKKEIRKQVGRRANRIDSYAIQTGQKVLFEIYSDKEILRDGTVYGAYKHDRLSYLTSTSDVTAVGKFLSLLWAVGAEQISIIAMMKPSGDYTVPYKRWCKVL